jgi:hypothetical protein
MLPLIGLGALSGEGELAPSPPPRRRLHRRGDRRLGRGQRADRAARARKLVRILSFLAGARGHRRLGLGDRVEPGRVVHRTIADRNLYAAILFVAGAALIVALGWRRHRAHPWVLFTPVLAWFMLSNKVYSPQFDLWLYPVCC